MYIPSGVFKREEPSEEEKQKLEEQKRQGEERQKQLKIERPHICEWCKQPDAYIGSMVIECSNPACPKYVPFKWPREEGDDNVDRPNE